MNSRTIEPDAPAPRSPAIKFTFASGARPLAGYTIKRGIGRGGFGEVYYAVSDAGKEIALKLIRRNLDVELRGVTQCLNLKHPHLLSLHDVKDDDQGNCWVVMEHVAGESLEDLLDRSPQGLPPQAAMDWMRGIAAGVTYLHDHGIVHRDLKPGNIFNDEGVIKVGDYGLSKFISCSRRSGQTESIGTVHYMAPEVANGRYGREIDIYALGIMLFEMLTGRVPFEGESIGEVLMKHLTAEPDLAVVAEPYREVIKRALAKDPAIRFRTVEEMMAALPATESQPVFRTIEPATAARPAPKSPPAESVPYLTETSDDEEPIWRWIRTTWQRRDHDWKDVVVLIVIAFVAMRMGIFGGAARFTGVSVVELLVLYFAYRLVRKVWISSTRGTHSTPRTRAVAQARPITTKQVTQPVSNSHSGVWYALKAVLGALALGALVGVFASQVAYRGDVWLPALMIGATVAYVCILLGRMLVPVAIRQASGAWSPVTVIGSVASGAWFGTILTKIANHRDFLFLPAAISCGLVTYVLIILVRSVMASFKPPSEQIASAVGVASPTTPPVLVVSESEIGAVRKPTALARRMEAIPAQTRYLKPIFIPGTPRERVAELLGSLLVAAIVSLVVSFVMVLLRGHQAEPEQYAWVGLVSTLGAWSILALSKLWEGRSGDVVLRRFVMLILGLTLGGVAYLIGTALHVDLPFDKITLHPSLAVPGGFYRITDGAPLLPAYMVYFGFLFLILRWWTSSDPLRPARFRFWHTASALLAAWLLSCFWRFPQPWGLIVAATISIAVQLAAPWTTAARESTTVVER